MVRKSPDQQEGTENPRTTRVRKIVLDAATDLLIDQGHHAVTPQRVSTVTGVARSTIYRLWPDPVSLLLDAIDRVLAPDHAAPTVGDLGRRSRHRARTLAVRLNRRPFRAIFVALLDTPPARTTSSPPNVASSLESRHRSGASSMRQLTMAGLIDPSSRTRQSPSSPDQYSISM